MHPGGMPERRRERGHPIVRPESRGLAPLRGATCVLGSPRGSPLRSDARMECAAVAAVAALSNLQTAWFPRDRRHARPWARPKAGRQPRMPVLSRRHWSFDSVRTPLAFLCRKLCRKLCRVRSVRQAKECSPITSSGFMRKHWLWPLAPKCSLPPGGGGKPSLTSAAGLRKALCSTVPRGPGSIRVRTYAMLDRF